MKFTALQIADIIDGEVDGNPEVELSKLAKIEEGTLGSLTFLSNPKYTPHIYTTKASAVIVNKDFFPENDIETTLIKVEDSYTAFTKLLEYYQIARNNKVGIEQLSFIDETAEYGEGLYLAAFSYISDNVKMGDQVKIHSHVHIGSNVTIGSNVLIHSGVKILADSVIGNDVILNSGVVLGSDGFGFSPNSDGTYTKVPQTGNVIIGDGVEIGALTTIDRATLGSTVIKSGVKLDNQIQIAHNVEIGENTVIASQTGIAGSTKIGKNCKIGGQVGIVGHITIGDNVSIQAQSGIGRNVADNEVLQGSPAFGYGDYNRSYVHFKNLKNIVQRINELEKNSDNDSNRA